MVFVVKVCNGSVGYVTDVIPVNAQLVVFATRWLKGCMFGVRGVRMGAIWHMLDSGFSFIRLVPLDVGICVNIDSLNYKLFRIFICCVLLCLFTVTFL